MKKILSVLTFVAAAFAFHSCEDIPAPYEINDEQTGGTSDVILQESFASSLGSFANHTASGAGSWIIDYSTAKISGYDNAAQTNTAGENWLVSSDINLTEVDSAYVTFEYILMYNRSAKNQVLYITDAYDAANPTANWEQLLTDFTPETNKDWNNFQTAEVQIPAKFLGKTVRIAFYHKCDASSSSTWEVKNLKVLHGKLDNAGGGGNGGETSEDVILQEDFATTLGTFANKTQTGAGSWIIDYSTAKISGYDNAAQTNTAGENWLVSSDIKLENEQAAHVKFEYILMYNRAAKNQVLYITEAYDETKPFDGWEMLLTNFTPETNKDWNNFQTADVQIPAKFMGKTVRIAFYHFCDDKSSSTWEVKNLKVLRGNAAGGGEETPEVGGVKQLPYSEAFTTTLGAFQNFTTSGKGEWVIDYSTAKATGWDGSATTAGTYYLVSPEVSLAGATEAHVAFEYILRYNRGDENQQFFITENFNAEKPEEGWTLLSGKFTEGTDWTTFYKEDIQLDAKYLGKTVRFAFRYSCDAVNGSTWEVRNFSVQAGKAGESGDVGGDTPTLPGGEIFANGGFEEWNGNVPAYWKTACTAGNAVLSQSTDARTGSYAVCVAGSTQNKRIAFQETTVPAGTYKMAFYVKAATAEGGSCCPGYVPIKDDGKVGTYVYKQGDDGKNAYVNNISSTEWTLVENTFTLAEEQTICILVMNSRNPGKDILIDDFTFEKVQ